MKMSSTVDVEAGPRLRISASPIVATLSPLAPAPICMLAISTHLWLFAWGRNAIPDSFAKDAIAFRLPSRRRAITNVAGVGTPAGQKEVVTCRSYAQHGALFHEGRKRAIRVRGALSGPHVAV